MRRCGEVSSLTHAVTATRRGVGRPTVSHLCAVVALALSLSACVATAAFEPPPPEALAQISVSLERGVSSTRIALHNRSRWDARYLFPLFACSRSGDLYEDAAPREAARFVSADPERDIWERALGAGRSAEAPLSRSPCADPAERAGVYFKLERDGVVTYRVIWSPPIGPALTGS